MRADRLLSILLLMQVNRHMTARDLSRRLEVSERTIYRDMEALSIAGVPVFAERGSNGGWFLQSNYQTRLNGLNETEIQALFLAQPAHLLKDLGLQNASESALIKLLVALPAFFRRDAEFARQHIHIDAAGWYAKQREPTPHLLTLQDAIWQERQVQITYQRNDESIVERLVHPLGLVAKGQTWYLVATADEETRTYRVSRIQTVAILDIPCVRPASFDLATYWEQSTINFKSQLPRYPVVLRTTPKILERLRLNKSHPIVQEQMQTNGTEVIITMQFEVDWQAHIFLIGWGKQVEVLEPVALRESIIEAAQGIVEMYQASNTLSLR